MMPLRSLCFSLAAALLFGTAQADTVSISGAVLQPGSYQWNTDARLHDVTVAGRVQAQLNPFQLMIAQNNQLLEPGDRLVYPTRPSQVRVLGAVNGDCELVFDAALRLKDYLNQCPAHPVADRSFVYVIQPDGQVEHIGIAHWNEQPVNIAMGALIYRPLGAARISPETTGLNQDMAALLATQYQLGGHFSE